MIKRDSKGRFSKGGSNAWNKGKKCHQISIALKGKTDGFQKGNQFWDNNKVRETQFKKGQKPWIEGKGHSEDIRKKISENTKKGMTKDICKRLSEIKKKAIRSGNLVMPKKDTSIEIKIQNFLKQLGISFMTHQYMKDIEHGYQCDIFIPSMNLVIECDGNYWHKYPTGNEIDHVRTKELIEKGFKVLRLWEFEIKEMKIKEFLDRIRS
jgi:very-short-patch-repair endonuclease